MRARVSERVKVSERVRVSESERMRMMAVKIDIDI